MSPATRLPSDEPAERQPRILIVEDEPALVASLTYSLRREGFAVEAARDGREGLRLATQSPPDLLILDLMLPGVDGMEVCRRLRAVSDTPVLMLTARSEEADRVLGLELGADDYVTKPFSMRELVARVRAILRRAGRREPQDERPIIAGSLRIEPAYRRVLRDGREVPLRPREMDLLLYMAARPHRPLTRETLLRDVWKDDIATGPRTVDVHIRWLREKLEEDPARPRRLVTVRGYGYKFVP
ncbi:MAG TPA: response regulator transcription factor [Dehalococcoidia bacterium]|nr:response regulator transcription factor [Dehalococcoidia bacterium]